MNLKATDLELNIMLRIEAGEDPYLNDGSGTRRVSQALGRLRRKEFIDGAWQGQTFKYTLTFKGHEQLIAERGVGGRLWKNGALWR